MNKLEQKMTDDEADQLNEAEYIKRENARRQQKLRLSHPPQPSQINSLYISIAMATLIVFLSTSDKVISKAISPFSTSQELINEQIEHILEIHIQQRTLTYKDRIQDCEPIVYYFDSFCSRKLIDLQIDFRFSIGYEPELGSLVYDEQTGQIVKAEWGELKVLKIDSQTRLISQQNGYLNSWTAFEFQNKTKERQIQIEPIAFQMMLQSLHNESLHQGGLIEYRRGILGKIADVYSSNRRKSISELLLSSANELLDAILGVTNENQTEASRKKYQVLDHKQYQMAKQPSKQEFVIMESTKSTPIYESHFQEELRDYSRSDIEHELENKNKHSNAGDFDTTKFKKAKESMENSGKKSSLKKAPKKSSEEKAQSDYETLSKKLNRN